MVPWQVGPPVAESWDGARGRAPSAYSGRSWPIPKARRGLDKVALRVWWMRFRVQNRHDG